MGMVQENGARFESTDVCFAGAQVSGEVVLGDRLLPRNLPGLAVYRVDPIG